MGFTMTVMVSWLQQGIYILINWAGKAKQNPVKKYVQYQVVQIKWYIHAMVEYAEIIISLSKGRKNEMLGKTLQVINQIECENSIPFTIDFITESIAEKKPDRIWLIHLHDKYGFWGGSITITARSKNQAHRRLKRLFPTFKGVPVFIHPLTNRIPKHSLSLRLGHGGANWAIQWLRDFEFIFGCTTFNLHDWVDQGQGNSNIPLMIQRVIKEDFKIGYEKINQFFRGLYEWGKEYAN